MSFLSNIFSSAHDNIPLHERDIIEIAPKGLWGKENILEDFDPRVINAETILQTGKIPLNSFSDQSSISDRWKNGHIDWNSDDAFTRALNQIEQEVITRIQASPTLQGLLNKEVWHKEDRVTWEREVSTFVSEEMYKIAGLGQYRSITETEGYPIASQRAIRLNDLSDDIENGTTNYQSNCLEHSLLEAMILQRLDKSELPAESNNQNHKVASNYFIAIGQVSFNAEYKPYNHAFIVSSATGNIIEATNDPSIGKKSSQYEENVDPGYTFEDFVRGKIAVHTRGSVYGGFHIEGAVAQLRIDNKELNVKDIYERIDTNWKNQNEAPPHIQALAIMKESNLINQFDNKINQLISDGDIYSVLEFMKQNSQTEIASSQQRTKQLPAEESTESSIYQENTQTTEESVVAEKPNHERPAPISFEEFLREMSRKDLELLNVPEIQTKLNRLAELSPEESEIRNYYNSQGMLTTDSDAAIVRTYVLLAEELMGQERTGIADQDFMNALGRRINELESQIAYAGDPEILNQIAGMGIDIGNLTPNSNNAPTEINSDISAGLTPV